MARAGVVGMGMRDDGALDRADRVDVEPAGLAVQPFRLRAEPGVGMRHRVPDGRRRGDFQRVPAEAPSPPSGMPVEGWDGRNIARTVRRLVRPPRLDAAAAPARGAGRGRAGRKRAADRADRRRQDAGRLPALPDRPRRSTRPRASTRSMSARSRRSPPTSPATSPRRWRRWACRSASRPAPATPRRPPQAPARAPAADSCSPRRKASRSCSRWRTRPRCSPACAPSSSTRSTRWPAPSAATSSPSASPASPTLAPAGAAASASPPPSPTRRAGRLCLADGDGASVRRIEVADGAPPELVAHAAGRRTCPGPAAWAWSARRDPRPHPRRRHDHRLRQHPRAGRAAVPGAVEAQRRDAADRPPSRQPRHRPAPPRGGGDGARRSCARWSPPPRSISASTGAAWTR